MFWKFLLDIFTHILVLKLIFELYGFYVIPEKELPDVKSFNSQNKVINVTTNLELIFEEFVDEILAKAADFQERDSGWMLQETLFLDVNINQHNPLSASS